MAALPFWSGQPIVRTMRRLLPLLAIAAAEYDGACDGQAWSAQTAMTIAAGATYATFYAAKYSDTTCGSSGGSLYSYGTTMNYESLNCGVDVCARCVQGVLTLGYFPDGAPDALWSDTTDASFTGTATAIAEVDCNDGCGEECLSLGSISVRVAWHSDDGPLCSAAPSCPTLSPTTTAAPSSSSLAADGARRADLSSALATIVAARYLLN